MRLDEKIKPCFFAKFLRSSREAFLKKQNKKKLLKVLRESRGHFFKSAHMKYYFEKIINNYI